MARIGFIGLGRMGAPMACNLMAKGHRVAGFDLSADAREAAREKGLPIAASAAQAASGADVVITMLPAGAHVYQAWLGEAGLANACRPDALLMDCSTIDVATARDVAKAVSQEMVDAPVSGGVAGAEAARLTFMVGGATDSFTRAKPFLQAMGTTVLHCGAAGAGQAAKICNNLMLASSMAATCEAFLLAEQLGLSAQALFDVAARSSGQSWSVSSYCPVPGPVPTSPANRGYEAGFSAVLMAKDAELAQQAARAGGVPSPMTDLALQLYRRLIDAGQGGRDFSALIEWLRATPREALAGLSASAGAATATALGSGAPTPRSGG